VVGKHGGLEQWGSHSSSVGCGGFAKLGPGGVSPRVPHVIPEDLPRAKGSSTPEGRYTRGRPLFSFPPPRYVHRNTKSPTGLAAPAERIDGLETPEMYDEIYLGYSSIAIRHVHTTGEWKSRRVLHISKWDRGCLHANTYINK